MSSPALQEVGGLCSQCWPVSRASDRRSACPSSSRAVHGGHHERAHLSCGAGAMKRWIFRLKKAVRGASDPLKAELHIDTLLGRMMEKRRSWSREAVGSNYSAAERVAWLAREALVRQGDRVAQVIPNCWRASWQAPACTSSRWW